MQNYMVVGWGGWIKRERKKEENCTTNKEKALKLRFFGLLTPMHNAQYILLPFVALLKYCII